MSSTRCEGEVGVNLCVYSFIPSQIGDCKMRPLKKSRCVDCKGNYFLSTLNPYDAHTPVGTRRAVSFILNIPSKILSIFVGAVREPPLLFQQSQSAKLPRPSLYWFSFLVPCLLYSIFYLAVGFCQGNSMNNVLRGEL